MAPSQSSAPSARRRLNACGMRIAEQADQPADDLVDAESGRVDGEMRLPVEGRALSVQGLDLRGGSAVEHRPLAAMTRALVELAEVSVEPHHGAERLERLQPALATGQPA